MSAATAQLIQIDEKRARKSHIFPREPNGHYVEERWVSMRLFDVERFEGEVHDPCAGFGHIPMSAEAHGLHATACDLVDRGYPKLEPVGNFLESKTVRDNIASNPPYGRGIFKKFALHAMKLSRRKVALVWTVKSLPAAHWLNDLPVSCIWFLNPRPSMPPGYVFRELEAAGKRPSGDTKDYCWVILEHGFCGQRTFRWLKRNG